MPDPSVSSWMPIWIGDYLADTMHLTTQQHGAYLLLLFAYWKTGGPLPDNDDYLAAVTKLSLSDWRATRSIVAGFFKIEAGFWHQKRAEIELEKAKHLKVAHAKGAAKTNAKRYGEKPPLAERIAERQEGVAERVALGVAVVSPPPPPSPSVHSVHSENIGTLSTFENESERKFQVEPPKGFPRTEKEAIDGAVTSGVLPDFARKVYLEVVGIGYLDRRGLPIKNWLAHVKGAFLRQQDWEARNGLQKINGSERPDPNDPKSKLLAEIEELQENMKTTTEPRFIEKRKRQIADLQTKLAAL